MKNAIFFIALLFAATTFTMTSCDPEEVTVDSSQPQGALTVSKSGTFIAENGTPTKGKVELGKDDEGTNFVTFGSDFTTQLATGTVSVYLSTSSVFTADPGMGNPDLKLIGSISTNGSQNFKLSAAPDAKFTHVILWCNTAGIPFGYAALN